MVLVINRAYEWRVAQAEGDQKQVLSERSGSPKTTSVSRLCKIRIKKP